MPPPALPSIFGDVLVVVGVLMECTQAWWTASTQSSCPAPWILGFSESSYRLVCFRLEVQGGFVLAYKIKSLARWNWRRRTIRTHACICLQCKHRILAGLCTSGSSNCSVVGESLPGLSLKPRRKILVNKWGCCCCKCQSFGVIISLARLPLHARSWPSRRWRKSGNRCLRRAIAMPVIE